MNAALTWLNDLFQWLGRWVPRLVLIHPTHAGVKFGPNGSAVRVGPGLVLYWPITHDLIQVPVTLQSIQVSSTALGDVAATESHWKVPQVVLCVINIQFKISDPIRASVNVLQFNALVANRAQSMAVDAWKKFRQEDSKADYTLPTESLREELNQYGIDLVGLEVAGFGTGIIMKQLADWSYADSGEVKR